MIRSGLALGLVALAGLLAGCDVNKGSYVRANERIVEALPEIPGSERVRVISSPYYDPEQEAFSRIIGYTTNVVYRMPHYMTMRDVVDFYTQRLGDEWQLRAEEIPVVEAGTGRKLATVLLAHFTRGEAGVSVNTDGMLNGGKTVEVSVDHRRNRDQVDNP